MSSSVYAIRSIPLKLETQDLNGLVRDIENSLKTKATAELHAKKGEIAALAKRLEKLQGNPIFPKPNTN